MKKQKAYETMLVLFTALAIIYLVSGQRIVLWIGIGISIVSLLVPVLATKIHQAWFWLAKILSIVSGTVLLTLVYILFILPISLFIRKKLSVNRNRGFRIRNHLYQKQDIENPW